MSVLDVVAEWEREKRKGGERDGQYEEKQRGHRPTMEGK